jgi:hypothetical protein
VYVFILNQLSCPRNGLDELCSVIYICNHRNKSVDKRSRLIQTGGLRFDSYLHDRVSKFFRGFSQWLQKMVEQYFNNFFVLDCTQRQFFKVLKILKKSLRFEG